MLSGTSDSLKKFMPLVTREFCSLSKGSYQHTSQDLHEELKAYKGMEVRRIGHYVYLIKSENGFFVLLIDKAL